MKIIFIITTLFLYVSKVIWCVLVSHHWCVVADGQPSRRRGQSDDSNLRRRLWHSQLLQRSGAQLGKGGLSAAIGREDVVLYLQSGYGPKERRAPILWAPSRDGTVERLLQIFEAFGLWGESGDKCVYSWYPLPRYSPSSSEFRKFPSSDGLSIDVTFAPPPPHSPQPPTVLSENPHPPGTRWPSYWALRLGGWQPPGWVVGHRRGRWRSNRPTRIQSLDSGADSVVQVGFNCQSPVQVGH